MTYTPLKDYLETHKNEYGFLKTNPHLGENIALLGYGGSFAYGTNVETSDTDVRGFALPTKRDILLFRDFEQVCHKETDTVIYSSSKLLDLLYNCNPNVIELLGLEPEDYTCLTAAGSILLENRDLFLTQKCITSFGGYANQQLYRLRQKSKDALSDKKYEQHASDVLNSMISRFEKQDLIPKGALSCHLGDDDRLRFDLNVKDCDTDSLHTVLSELDATIRAYNKRSKRNDYAAAHDKIAKHSMHLIRLYYTCFDILEKHEIITKRKDEHDLLMAIRNKEYLDENGTPTKEFFDLVKSCEDRFNHLKETTTLPEKPDRERFENLKITLNMIALN